MDREDILILAEDSKIKLSEEEIKRFQTDFEDIKEKYKVLEDFDIEGFEPLFFILENKIVNRFNQDEILYINKIENELILDVDKMVDGFYQVPNKEDN